VADKAVDSAYQVLDDHLRRGREVAQQRTASEPRAAEAVPADPGRRVLRAIADTWQLWADLVTPLTARVARELNQAAAARPPRAAAPPPEVAFQDDDKHWREVRPSFFPDAPTNDPVALHVAHAALVVAIDVSAAKRHVVRVELLREPSAAGVVVLALQAIDGAAQPPLQGFVLVREDGEVVLRGEVPDAQPPGTYVGALVERGTGRPWGTVTLTLRG